MVQDIINYINFLSSNYGFSISIHNSTGSANRAIDSLTPYNIHRNPYCLYITSEIERHKQCVKYQHILRNIRSNSECLTCMCGVKQYVFPVFHGNEYSGFICVSGYKGSDEIISEYANKSNIPQKFLIKKAEAHLKTDTPDIQRLETLIKPLCAMVAILLKNSPDNSENSDLFNHILSVIHANVYSKLTIADIAKTCYCSESIASHLFKKKTGTTINKYISSLRMKKAEKLLLTTNESITKIAYDCGFSDSNYFVYSFSKTHGISPLKYRKSMGNLNT